MYFVSLRSLSSGLFAPSDLSDLIRAPDWAPFARAQTGRAPPTRRIVNNIDGQLIGSLVVVVVVGPFEAPPVPFL